MKEKIIKLKENISKLLLLDVKEDFSEYLDKKFEVNDIIVNIWGGETDYRENMQWSPFINNYVTVSSFLDQNIKVHMYFFEKEIKQALHLIEILKMCNPTSLDKCFSFSILKDDEFQKNNLYLSPVQRARKFGPPINFANFNFYLVQNSFYKNLIISHNDIIPNSSFNEFFKCLAEHSTSATIIWSSEFVDNFSNHFKDKIFGEYFDFDDFKTNHFHTAMLLLSEENRIKFNTFIKEGSKIFKKNEEVFVFPEQELLKMFSQKENIDFFNLLKYHSTLNKFTNKDADKSKATFNHYDEKGKFFLFYSKEYMNNYITKPWISKINQLLKIFK